MDDPGALGDGELVTRILRGDEEVFEVLVDRYKLRLFRFVSRYLGDPEDARDVTQEVFFKLYAALDSYDPKYRFSTWAFRIAGNAAIDHLRRKRIRALPLELPSDDESEGRRIDPVDGNAHKDTLRTGTGKLATPQEVEAMLGVGSATDGYCLRILNSWGDSWSDNGTGVLSGSKAIPDGAVAPSNVLAA